MAELQQLDINRLEKKVHGLKLITDEVNNHISNISTSIDTVKDDLKNLADSFSLRLIN